MFVFVPISALAQDNSESVEKHLTADALFDPTRILNVQIAMPADDWQSLCSQQRSFVEALGRESTESPFTHFKADLTLNGFLIRDVAIRKKGFLGW